MDSKQYLNSLKWLPRFMRDFHDQKDLFKAIQQIWPKQEISWRDGHIYTIDSFLKFMALHGYTLQKTRATGFAFLDIEKTVSDETEKRNKQSVMILESVLAESRKPKEPTP